MRVPMPPAAPVMRTVCMVTLLQCPNRRRRTDDGGQVPLCPLSSVLCPLSSVLCPLSSVLCPLSSVLCPLSSVLPLQRDEVSSNHHPALTFCLSMICFRKSPHPSLPRKRGRDKGWGFSGSCSNLNISSY